MRVILTNAVRQAWQKYCDDRPDEVFDDLKTIAEESLPMAERPWCLRGSHATAYQHPEFKSVYFPVVKNEDDECVFIGMRRVKAPKVVPVAADGTKKASAVIEWEPEPTGMNDEDLIAWCERQNAEAYRRVASRECESSACTARMAQIAIIRKSAGKRMSQVISERSKVVRPEFLRGRDKELGDVITFIAGKTMSTDELSKALLNYEHRYHKA